MITAWRVIGLLYACSAVIMIRDKYRKAEVMPDSVEDQLDIMIHTSEIEAHANGHR